MEVKGTGIIPIREFVQKMHPDRYRERVDSLPEESRKINSPPILYGSMHPYLPSVIEPTKKVIGLFFNGETKGARIMGRFAAEFALKGMLKIFIRIASPQFLMQRVSVIFGSYFT